MSSIMTVQDITKLCFYLCKVIFDHFDTLDLTRTLKDEMVQTLSVLRDRLDYLSTSGFPSSHKDLTVRLHGATIICYDYIKDKAKLQLVLYENRLELLCRMHPLIVLSFLDIFFQESMKSISKIGERSYMSTHSPEMCLRRLRLFTRDLHSHFRVNYPLKGGADYKIGVSLLSLEVPRLG